MAKASKGTYERQEIVKTVEPRWVLTLSQDEAETVAALCGHVIGGSYENSPRKHTYAILKALTAADVDTYPAKRLIKTPAAEFWPYSYPESLC